MNKSSGWELQTGGLRLKVTCYRKLDAADHSMAVRILQDCLRTITKSHSALFDEIGFQNNIAAIEDGRLKADLFRAKWNEHDEKYTYIGAAFGWRTFYSTPKRRIVLSEYTEDICLLSAQLRELIRKRPQGKEFPAQSLAACSERISLTQMRNHGVFYRFGEVDSSNTTMMRQLAENGAIMGTELDSAVLEYQKIPEDAEASSLALCTVHDIRSDGRREENNFYVRWVKNSHEIRFFVALGQSTAKGTPRVDIRPWYSGSLPEKDWLNTVVASALTAINAEVRNRNLVSTPPESHIFIQSDELMLSAFYANGAQTRLFGNKPMIPGTNPLLATFVEDQAELGAMVV